MTKQQQDVKTFMQTFGQATPACPTDPEDKTRILRVKLLLEEVLELAAASGVNVFSKSGDEINTTDDLQFSPIAGTDLVGVADALADIDYVNQGAAVAYGLDLEPFQTEVHRSNMTKLWTMREVDNMNDKEKAEYVVTAKGNRFLVKNAAGKVMKSPSYSVANLKAVLDAQTSTKG